MAREFMKVKRIVIPFLTVVIMLSQMSGCAVATPEDVVNMPDDVQIVIEEAELPSTKIGKLYDTNADAVSEDKLSWFTQAELVNLFEQYYLDHKADKETLSTEDYNLLWMPVSFSEQGVGSAEDATIYNRLEHEVKYGYDKMLPSDGFTQFVEWRIQYEQEHNVPTVTREQPNSGVQAQPNEPVITMRAGNVQDNESTPDIRQDSTTEQWDAADGTQIDMSLWDADKSIFTPPQDTAPSSYGFA